jgi:hypothetical protein
MCIRDRYKDVHAYILMPDVITCDGQQFNLDLEIVNKCKTLHNCLEDCGEDTISIPNVNSAELIRILEFHKTGKLSNTDDMLSLLSACDFLDYDELLDHGAKIVADSLRGKTATEIRRFFGL